MKPSLLGGMEDRKRSSLETAYGAEGGFVRHRYPSLKRATGAAASNVAADAVIDAAISFQAGAVIQLRPSEHKRGWVLRPLTPATFRLAPETAARQSHIVQIR